VLPADVGSLCLTPTAQTAQGTDPSLTNARARLPSSPLRLQGVNTLPWLCRLPFRWFMLVHAASLLDVSRAALPDVCASPAFSGPAARARFASLARWAGMLGHVAPMPGQPSDGGSCLERLAAVASNSSAGGIDSLLAASLGGCACSQVGVWVLLSVGFALPVAAQFLLETAARRNFLRQ